MKVGHLLVEWRGATSQLAVPNASYMGGYHRPCVRRHGCWTIPPVFGGGVGPITTGITNVDYFNKNIQQIICTVIN